MQKNDESPIIIEIDVWIASNFTIGKCVMIGIGSIIGANSFVNKDVKPYSIMGGASTNLIRLKSSK